MPSSADTLYRMDEKGIYYLSQDTVYTELWQKLPAPGAPPPESINLRSYYDKREYVYIAYSDAIAGDSTSRIHDIRIIDNLLYTASDGDTAIIIVDISDSTDMRIVGYLQDKTNILTPEHVEVVGGIMYLSNYGTGGLPFLSAFDVSNPDSIYFLSRSPSGTGAYYDFYVDKNLAYVTERTNGAVTGTLKIINISNPRDSLYNVGSVSSSNLAYAADVRVSGTVAWVTSASNTSRLTSIDVSDPTNPTIIASLQDTDQLKGAVNIEIRGKYAFVTHQRGTTSGGLAVVNIQDAHNPYIAGHLSTGYGTRGIEILGNLAILCSDDDTGAGGEKGKNSIYFVDISDPTSPSLTYSDSSYTYLYSAKNLQVYKGFAFIAEWFNNMLLSVDIGSFYPDTTINYIEKLVRFEYKAESPYKPFKWLVGGTLLGIGITSNDWRLGVFGVVSCAVFVFGD